MRSAVADVPVNVLLSALKAFGEADLKPDPNSTLPLDIALSECILGRDARPPAPAETAGPAPADRPVAPPRARQSAPEEAPPVRVQRPDQPATASSEPGEAPAVPKAVANGAAAAGSLLDAARAQMQQIYYAAKGRDARIGAFVNSACDIIDADDQIITFGFLHEPILAMVQQPQNLKVLAEVASEVLGRSVKVKCVHDPNVEPWTRRSPRNPLVRAAEQMGARVVSRNEE
jgi:hypothetical protein